MIKKLQQGIKLFEQKKYKEASQYLYYLSKKYPLNSMIKNTLAVTLKKLKKYEEAKHFFLEAISLEPTNPNIFANYSNLLKDMKEYELALHQISHAIKLKDDEPSFFNAKAVLFEESKKYDLAQIHYKIAVKIDPKFAKAINNIAVLKYKQKQYHEAVSYFHQALKADPEYHEVYSNIGATYNKLKQYTKAIEYLEKAIEKNPKNAGAYTNLGNVYNKLDKYKKALKLHQKSIELDPQGVNAYSNLANSYKSLGQFQNAITNYKKAIELDKNFTNAKFDLATTYLHTKEFKDGFYWYESRFQKEEMKSHIIKHKDIFLAPRLTNKTDVEGKKVLIHSEQGFGDSIQFSRFVEQVKERYKCEVILQCRDELKTLFEDSIKNVDIFYKRDSEPTPEFDYQISMLSLPYLFKVESLDDIPYKKKPYLFANSHEDIQVNNNKKIKIGICWGASVTGESFDGKVFDINYFSPLAKEEKIELYSLQVGEKVKDIKENGLQDDIVDMSEKLDSFAKTASLIEQLDLVISSDTSVAHLAGAMGKEVWVPLQKMPDWRWESKGKSSYWYPNANLFRQKSFRKWDSVFQSIYDKLNRKYKLKINKNQEELCQL